MVPKLKMAYLIDIAYLFWEFLQGVGGQYFGVVFYFTKWVRIRDAHSSIVALFLCHRKNTSQRIFQKISWISLVSIALQQDLKHFSDRRAYATGKEDAVSMRCESSIFSSARMLHTFFGLRTHTRWISLLNRPEQVRLAMESIPSRGPLPGDEALTDRSQSLNFQSQCTFPYMGLGYSSEESPKREPPHSCGRRRKQISSFACRASIVVRFLNFRGKCIFFFLLSLSHFW